MSSSHVTPHSSALEAAYDYCADLVRRMDRDRFLACLFAPADLRPHLLALHAFSIDVARVREVVREALPGEMRLVWWREVIEGQGRGAVEGHPVAYALMDTMQRFSLPPSALINLVDARIFDVYDDPMPTLNDLEGYAGETSSALVQLAIMILSPEVSSRTGDLAGHTGVAIAMTGLMRSLPIHASRGQCYVPLSMLAAHGGGRKDGLSGPPSPALRAALGELRLRVRHHLERAQAEFLTFAREERTAISPALLPLALVPKDLRALEKIADPLREIGGVSAFGRQFSLWRAARRIRAGGNLLP